MLYGLNDAMQRRRMIEQSEAGDERKRVERRKLDAMLAYCELATCRRINLLSYFGETLESPCGHCDTCLEPPETWDATEPARKLLSAVYRTGQRFGANYLIDHLRGDASSRAERLGHTRLSTFGVGEELEEKQWRSVIRQLVAHGYLETEPEGGGLCLNGSAHALLRGEQSVRLRKDRKSRRGKARAAVADMTPADGELWEALRAERKRLADEQDVPAFVIFSDATLQEMVAHRPVSKDEFLMLNGVGEKKLASYADAFLDVIALHQT
jgi:ATP-dependent DNA helicase RecQ